MARDGRGTPGRIELKNHQPKLRLADVIRRRRTTLRAFIDSLGITTYAALDNMCRRLGVVSPTEEEFLTAMPLAQRVNSPMEGIIVLEPPAVVDDISGRQIDPEAPIQAPGIEVKIRSDEPDPEPTEGTQKKPRRKKEATSTEP